MYYRDYVGKIWRNSKIHDCQPILENYRHWLLKHEHTKVFSIKDRQWNDWKQTGERCLTQLCHFLTTCIFYKAFKTGRFADTPKTNFRLYWQKVLFRQLAWGDFHAHLLDSNVLEKNYSAIAWRKNIMPFYPARTGINFPYFQLARRSSRFPSQLISQNVIFPS